MGIDSWPLTRTLLDGSRTARLMQADICPRQPNSRVSFHDIYTRAVTSILTLFKYH
jgi:hypothetical protein